MQDPVHNLIGKPKLDIHTHLTKNRINSGIIVENIFKSFGKTRALDSISFNVKPGTILALLGPNGAGKTTLIRILITLLKPDSGKVTVGGYDIADEANDLRAIMGSTGQNTTIDNSLTGRENLQLVGRLYHFNNTKAIERAQELLEEFDLIDVADCVAETYSGGMRRRLDLASSLVSRPKILFLDEPTAGLDPRSRAGLWQMINKLVEEGTTILLTTQYMDEADHLADNIVVVDHGKIIAEGTSSDLKSRVGGDVIEIHLADHDKAVSVADLIRSLGSAEPTIDSANGKISLPVTKGVVALVEVVRQIDNVGIALDDIVLRRPTLDDVFLTLTGHPTII